MDLMTLAAKITLDDSQFNKGVNKAESSGKKLAGKMSAMTVAVGNIAADLIRKGASAVSSIVGGAIEGYANYEQLVGGVETLFKLSSNKVLEYANKSYKTTGLSANQYMETVTSFAASMLQGLGGDTEKAADMANMAVTDMADNANKMGTDISAIQNAYQGFAKQNYTMLDNLKLGYGGTREEMIRLINDSGILSEKITSLDGITFDQIVQAIHEIQTQMGITGTTAEEAAETISGSKASLKAAWLDMLAAVGGAGGQENFDQTMENFKESFSTFMSNFVPTLVTTITNSGGLVGAIADAITELPTTLLAEVGDTAMSSGADMIRGVSNVTSWLIDSLVNAFASASADNQSAVDLGAAIGDFLGTAISKIVTNAGTIFEGIVALGSGLAEGLAQGLFEGLFGKDAEVDKITEQLSGDLTDAQYKATKSGAILDYMQTLIETYGQAATDTEEWKQSVSELESIMPGASQTIKDFGSDVAGAVTNLQQLSEQMREAAINAGMMKALQDAYGLLAEQQMEYRTAEASADRNRGTMDYIRSGVIDTIMGEAAGRMAWMTDQFGNYENMGAGQKDLYNKYQALSEGMSHVGDRMTELADLDFDGLKDALTFLDSESYSDEEWEGIKQAYKEAKDAAEYAEAEKERLSKEIDSTENVIQDTETAVKSFNDSLNSAAPDVESGGEEAAAAVEQGGSAVAAALAAAAAAIGSISFSGGGGGGALGIFGNLAGAAAGYVASLFRGHATGLDYVPYDGYRAELHRGEMIVPKNDADRFRNGAGTTEIVGALQNLNNNIQNIQLVVGRKTFGRAVVGYGGNRMNGYIGQAESRRASGYGT